MTEIKPTEADTIYAVPARYIQHETVCRLKMQMGAKCSCGLAALNPQPVSSRAVEDELRQMLSMFVDAAKPRGPDGFHEMPRFSATEIRLAREARARPSTTAPSNDVAVLRDALEDVKSIALHGGTGEVRQKIVARIQAALSPDTSKAEGVERG